MTSNGSTKAMTPVAEHLSVSPSDRDLQWLHTALQSAIELEHATLPLYLSGMYSLKTQNYTGYNLIRSVAMEEMVHMAIACNILAAIGGSPQIKDINAGFPSKGLPGGAEPDFFGILAPVSKVQLKNYLRVEMPDFLLPEEYSGGEYPTIAKLYDAIRATIEDNADQVRAAMKAGGPANQVGDDIGFTTIVWTESGDPLNQIYAGIQEILEQGEGATSRTLHAGPASEGEPSHYARFAELYYEARYEEPASGIELTRETEPEFFKGYRVPFPDVVNTLAVPSDGYAAVLSRDPKGAEVEKNILRFDQTYTDILNDLDAMWNGPEAESWPTFGKAVASMSEMRVQAGFYIMQSQVPSDIISDLASLYPDEYSQLAKYTDLSSPVYYGPRFRNLNLQ